jgi:hypothetical protein
MLNKKKSRINNIIFWTEGVIATFFIVNLVLFFLNSKFSFFSSVILGYSFWLSLGLYIGFQILKYEMKIYFKELNKNQKD